MTVSIYYRDDATGFVKKFAGQKAGEQATRAEAEHIIRLCPNGDQMEVRDT